MAEVIINGIKLGTIETITILQDLNKNDIKFSIKTNNIQKEIEQFGRFMIDNSRILNFECTFLCDFEPFTFAKPIIHTMPVSPR